MPENGKKSPKYDKRAAWYRNEADAREGRIHAVPPCAEPSAERKGGNRRLSRHHTGQHAAERDHSWGRVLSHRAPRLLVKHPVAISAVAARVPA
jgi:hypothetical protein